jgi:hypothetical protein
VRAHCSAGLDPAVFGADAARPLFDSNLGRLRITSTPNGGSTGKNAAGQCTELNAFGARSFTVVGHEASGTTAIYQINRTY